MFDDDDTPPWKTEAEIKLVLPDAEPTRWHKNWFSNMLCFDEPLIYDDISYLAVENFYQSMKVPRDRQDLRKQIAAMTPHKSKSAIRKAPFFPWDAEWTRAKSLKVMEFALRHKFFPGTSWHQQLMATCDEEIVEWNNWSDTVWGKDLNTKEGENYLGRILMGLRSEYQKTSVQNKASNKNGIYIGRGSLFGNPYTHISDKETKAEFIVETREESLDKFKEYFYDRVKNDKLFKRSALQLKNETMLCYCKPKSCHGDIILDWLFKQNSLKLN